MRMIREKLTSRKFLAVLICTLWWLIEGTVNGMWAELGWKIVAVVLGYLGVEGARDLLLAYFREKQEQTEGR